MSAISRYYTSDNLLFDGGALVKTHQARPADQRDDYLMWINDAKRESTKLARLRQMLDELERGGVYMRMKWNG